MKRLRGTASTLARLALSLPETREDHPWGEQAFKVRNKIFLVMNQGDDSLRLSFKLPDSNAIALMMPFASPTRYGLGKNGWVSASFAKGDDPPAGMLADWLRESYRAVAPKKLSAVAPAEKLKEIQEAKRKS